MSTLRKKTSKIMLLAVAGLLVTAISTGSVLYLLWQDGAFLPGWITWQERNTFDASGAYEMTLDRRTVEIRYQDSLIWTSPKKVKIQDALCCDIDNDGADELVLLCWKIGRYGKYRPFWVKEDEEPAYWGKINKPGPSIFLCTNSPGIRSAPNGCLPIWG